LLLLLLQHLLKIHDKAGTITCGQVHQCVKKHLRIPIRMEGHRRVMQTGKIGRKTVEHR
jgi:hypothetical protein